MKTLIQAGAMLAIIAGFGLATATAATATDSACAKCCKTSCSSCAKCSVWSRIEAAETRKGAGLSTLFSWVQLLAIPRIAVTTAALALFGGVLIGGVQAHSAREERYLFALKPSVAASHLR